MQKSTNNLKALRAAKKLTLKKLSDATGVPVSSIGAFEKGTRPLNNENRKLIENFLGVEIVESDVESRGMAASRPPQCVNDPGDSLIEERSSVAYKVRVGIWKDADSEKLEALLHEYALEKDWGAVEKIAAELFNRKLKERLR